MLGELVGSGEDVAILDMEASIEHMSRGTVRNVETLLVVVEPYFRALETAGRMAELARGLGIPRVVAVANKIHDEADSQAVRDYCARHGLAVIATVPFDRAVVEADRAGAALIDQAPDSPAVAEIRRLAHDLTGQGDGQGGERRTG